MSNFMARSNADTSSVNKNAELVAQQRREVGVDNEPLYSTLPNQKGAFTQQLLNSQAVEAAEDKKYGFNGLSTSNALSPEQINARNGGLNSSVGDALGNGVVYGKEQYMKGMPRMAGAGDVKGRFEAINTGKGDLGFYFDTESRKSGGVSAFGGFATKSEQTADNLRRAKNQLVDVDTYTDRNFIADSLPKAKERFINGTIVDRIGEAQREGSTLKSGLYATVGVIAEAFPATPLEGVLTVVAGAAGKVFGMAGSATSGFLESNGFKISQRYFDRLLQSGRGDYPVGIITKEVIEAGQYAPIKLSIPSRPGQDFYYYKAAANGGNTGFDVIVNPATKEIL